MTSLQCTMAKIKTFIKDLPECVHIPTRATCYIHQIDGDDTLIEAAVVFLTLDPVPCICHIFGGSISSKERAAAHTRPHATLEFLHNLCRDIIRDHTLCSTLCSQFSQPIVCGSGVDIVFIQHINQLRECRSNIRTNFIFDTFDALLQRLFDNNSQVITSLTGRNLVQIHKHSDKRSLTIGCHQGNNLILNRLNTTRNLSS